MEIIVGDKMKEAKNIGIDITENGYIITAGKKRFVFDDIKKMREWIEENIAPTGETKQFSDALDDDTTSVKQEAVYGSSTAYYNTANKALEQIYDELIKKEKDS
jgi:hypothetical protein